MAVEEPASGRPDDIRLKAHAALAGLRLDGAWYEMRERIDESAGMRDRFEELLDAVLAVSSELELDPTLQRIVRAATELVDARYGELEISGDDEGGPVEFGYVGTDEARAGSARAFREHRPGHGLLDVPVRVRGTVLGELRLFEKRDGAGFTEDDEVMLHALAAAAGVAIDNARLFEQFRMRERWLGAVAEINGELLGGASVADTLDLVVRRACELLEAEAACILLPSDKTAETLAVTASAGGRRDRLATLTVELGEDSAFSTTVRQQRPRLFPELSLALPAVASAGFGPAAVAPLTHTTSTEGALLVARATGAAAFTAERLPMLTSLADQAAVALGFAEEQHNQRLAELFDERDRIAQGLHDHVIRRLFAIAMHLQGTLRRIDDRNVRSRVEHVVDQLDATVREIRTSVFDLHTTDTQGERSLRRRLLDIVEELTADSGPTPTVRLSGPLDTHVPSRVGEHAEAVLREALSNALRHSGSRAIRIAVEVDRGRLSVDVADDGVGMPKNVRRSGLENLARRARQCGGEFIVADEPGGGTHVTWRVPL
ncbi:sensor histidine kinase [Saccharomonospora viridis]|uniref:sensor histidine kinase n=1 Tax=Saccharomonospora viridis TaxID=1852 RepID=UPI00240A924C|nr:GAF domain-containing protein [Saccharomonospora viridis]